MLESVYRVPLEKIAEIGLSQSRQPATENTLIQGPMPERIAPKREKTPNKPQVLPKNKPTIAPKKDKPEPEPEPEQTTKNLKKESPIVDPKVQNQIFNLEKKKYMLDKVLVKKEQTKNTLEESALKRNKNKEQKETPNTTGINNVLEGLARKKNQIDKRIVMLQRKSNISNLLREIAQTINKD